MVVRQAAAGPVDEPTIGAFWKDSLVTSDEPSDGPSDDNRNQRSDWAKAGIIGALGFEFVGFIVVGLLGGRWLDQRYGTEPAGQLVGMLFGLVAASLHVYKMVTRLMATDDDTT